jgi:hypothetical protein
MVQETERLEEMTKSIMLSRALMGISHIKSHGHMAGRPWASWVATRGHLTFPTPYFLWKPLTKNGTKTILGVAACRVSGLRPFFTTVGTPRHVPLLRGRSLSFYGTNCFIHICFIHTALYIQLNHAKTMLGGLGKINRYVEASLWPESTVFDSGLT